MLTWLIDLWPWEEGGGSGIMGMRRRLEGGTDQMYRDSGD
jgi:hypothetical protein